MNAFQTYDSLNEYLNSTAPYFLRNEINLSPEQQKQLSIQLDRVKSTTSKTGQELEKFVSMLFNFINLHEIYMNKRTSTNEIDLFLKSTDLSKIILGKIYPLLSDNFLIECKDYNKKLSVTWTGKFYSLLRQADFKLGLIFTLKPLTGRNNWHAAKGFCSKVALKEDVYILNFDISDMEKICGGDNFINILESKVETLKYDINFEKDIEKHENESKITY